MNGLNIYAIGLILGGLAIFIYGINLMSDALKSIAELKSGIILQNIQVIY